MSPYSLAQIGNDVGEEDPDSGDSPCRSGLDWDRTDCGCSIRLERDLEDHEHLASMDRLEFHSFHSDCCGEIENPIDLGSQLYLLAMQNN